MFLQNYKFMYFKSEEVTNTKIRILLLSKGRQEDRTREEHIEKYELVIIC